MSRDEQDSGGGERRIIEFNVLNVTDMVLQALTICLEYMKEDMTQYYR